MRLVMMGTGAFAVPTFRRLYDDLHDVQLLVTQPAREIHDRRRAIRYPMRDVAGEHGTPILDPENVNTDETRSQIAQFDPDLLVVCAYGQILAPSTLEVARHGGINLHSSLLPKYRGAAPINWAIYHGETITGCTAIHMTAKLDAGPCIGRSELEIDPEETAAELTPRLAEIGAQLISESISAIQSGSVEAIPQDPQLATRAPKLKKSDGLIDWRRSGQQIKDQIRAMQPWPKCHTYWLRSGGDPCRIIVPRASIALVEQVAAPGTAIEMGKGRLVIATGDGAVELHEVQPEGKRALSAREFLNGHPVKAGDRFGEGY